MEKKENKEINFNYLCYKFGKNLEEVINNSGLPLLTAYYILRDTFNQVSDLKDQEMLKYMQEEHSNEQEKTISIPIKEIEEEE